MSRERERNEQGQYTGVDDGAVLDAVGNAGRIATARDIGEALDCTREAAYQRLSSLHERGLVSRRKVGGRAVVWWLTDEEVSPETRQGSAEPFRALIGRLDDEEAQRVRERAAEFHASVDEEIAATHAETSQ
jgi:predicted ArsR family transcriptional regulator